MKQRPFSSPLWEHVDLIRELRLKRVSWLAIAEVLKSDHGVDINYRSIHAFFKRLVTRKALPLGWERSALLDRWPTREEAESLLR